MSTGWPSNSGDTINLNPAEMPTETPEQFASRRDALIGEWLEHKEQLDAFKESERVTRDALSVVLFPTPKKGTQRYPLANGYGVKLVYGLNYTLGDKDKVNDEGKKIPIADQVLELESKIEAVGPIAKLLLERLIKWTPELSGTEYEKLDEGDEEQAKVKALIDEVLTITPKAPALTFEPPK